MNGLLCLLCCMEILGALLGGAQTILGPSAANLGNNADQDGLNSTSPPLIFKTSASRDMAETSSLMNRQSPTAVPRVSNSPCTSPSPGGQPFMPNNMFYRKDCLPVLMVAGGLIIVCTILLLSTLLLACRVCQLSGRIKALSSNPDLISTSQYWVGTAKKNKNKPDTEPKETSVLIADVSQTRQENGATEEEEGKVNEEGQTGEEDKKEVGDTGKSEEASAPEDSSSSKPQDSQPTKAEAASTSESTEETKDVV
ncbi:uncharacterized protein LOC121617723 [Chelmon rostratus]|uniref:uncharacterized protein LOC121617723 n=1 Tax=Chelmon rostratus TaxID=109905 RepID=UPI001BEB7BC4|nr:uncharacterized protein LOC121617723 [Chelmon rostratus]